MPYNRMEVAARIGLAVLGCVGVMAAPVAAQQPMMPPFAWFTPGRCAVTPQLVESLSRRDNPDTLVYSPSADTALRTTTDSARVCDEVYHGMTEQDRELLNLARVKLAMGNDVKAADARQRYLATLASRPAREQAWAYYLILTDNLGARPPRMVGAREALAKIDQLPFAETWKASMYAHGDVAFEAAYVWDEPLANAEANVMIAKFSRLTVAQQEDFAKAVAGLFLLKAEQALRLAGIAPAKAVLDTARAMIPRSAGGAYRMVMQATERYATLGKPAASIDAPFWFRASDATPRPARGRVTFVSLVPHYCGDNCQDRYRALGRYIARFGGRGLELVNATQTFGFYADTAPASPSAEARYDSIYFLGRKKLPGMLAVAETRYSWESDGRRQNEKTAQEINYPRASVVLVDKQGIVRYVADDFSRFLEEPLAQFIERLLAEPAGGTP